MTRPSPHARADYAVFRPLETRWADVDVYGHVNNVVHYALFDTAVNGWLIEAGLLDPREGPTVGLVVETACSYFREIVFPDRVDAGLRIARLGRSSVTYEIALFPGGDTVAAAQGRFTHVYVDRLTRRPRPLEADWRATLRELAHER